MDTSRFQAPFGIKLDKKWGALQRFPHTVKDFIHENDGPWPQPAPDNPVGQMAEVVHLPEQEKKDWRKFVGNMYIKRVLLYWPFGLFYALTHKHYKHFSDEEFLIEIGEGLYSKFLTPLDNGDEKILSLLGDYDASKRYIKADFSCMESIAPHCYEGMHASSSIIFFEQVTERKGDQSGLALTAIWLYESEQDAIPNESSSGKQRILTPQDGEAWHLAKFFVLQGAVHRVNLTEHALLHFPYDPINAVSKTILPKNHLLHQLLMPHFVLSLGVNHAVLEKKGSLINRDKHKFYSPFSAEGEYVRQLLPDGYLGRAGKPNAYPAFDINEFPKFPNSEYGDFLKAYYDVFEQFAKKVLETVSDENEDEHWMYVALWADSIEEWIPKFPKSEEIVEFTETGAKPLVIEGKPVGRERLLKMVALIMWDLSVAHATDHIAINKKRPEGNPFRIRVSAPYQQAPQPNWRDKIVKRRDLLTFWFTDLLFYKPNNVTELQHVDYQFKRENAADEKVLRDMNKEFLQQLKKCDQQLTGSLTRLPTSLDLISTSLQY